MIDALFLGSRGYGLLFCFAIWMFALAAVNIKSTPFLPRDPVTLKIRILAHPLQT